MRFSLMLHEWLRRSGKTWRRTQRGDMPTDAAVTVAHDATGLQRALEEERQKVSCSCPIA